MTAVRNESGRDIRLNFIEGTKQHETITIHAASTAKCSGVMPPFAGENPCSWVITDSQSRFTFADVSFIANLPDAFVSSSRLTKDFPCLRVTRHVSIAPDMTIHAERVIGYTSSEPAQFPIHYTTKQDVK